MFDLEDRQTDINIVGAIITVPFRNVDYVGGKRMIRLHERKRKRNIGSSE